MSEIDAASAAGGQDGGSAGRGATRARRWLKRLASLAAVLVAVAMGGLWFTNTKRLQFVYEPPSGVVRPGDSVTIAPSDSVSCNPNGIIFYRPGWFGRWQQTHVGQERDIIDWWSIEQRSYDQNIPCDQGEWSVTIPPDIAWSPIAVCSFEDECFRVDIAARENE